MSEEQEARSRSGLPLSGGRTQRASDALRLHSARHNTEVAREVAETTKEGPRPRDLYLIILPFSLAKFAKFSGQREQEHTEHGSTIADFMIETLRECGLI